MAVANRSLRRHSFQLCVPETPERVGECSRTGAVMRFAKGEYILNLYKRDYFCGNDLPRAIELARGILRHTPGKNDSEMALLRLMLIVMVMIVLFSARRDR